MSNEINYPTALKGWHLCTVEEKIDRLRDEIENLSRYLNRTNSDVTLLKDHHHGPEGKVAIGLHSAEMIASMMNCTGSVNLLR